MTLLLGALLELVNGIAGVGIAVSMFPILRKFSESMARCYLYFRLIEAIFCCYIVIAPLSVLKLSQELKAGTTSLQYLMASGELAIVQRTLAVDLLIPVFFCIGAALFYHMLYKSRLLPRFISVWGIIAVIMIFAMNLVSYFQAINLDMSILMILALPMILNEIFLGIWLILGKGVRS